MRPPAPLAAIALALLAGVACARAAAPGTGVGASPAPDTARGIVQLTGNLPGASLQLVPTPRQPGEVLDLAGADSALLLPLAGLEVMVEGERGAVAQIPRRPRFLVRAFTVRAADGTAAHDGVLAREGAGYVLLTRDGARRPLPFLPPALRAHVGARIYLAGPLSAAPAAYGVIAAAKP